MRTLLAVGAIAFTAACAHRDNHLARWADFRGDQELWPISKSTYVIHTKAGIPAYKPAPLFPYDVVGLVTTAGSLDSAAHIAKSHGCDAITLLTNGTVRIDGGSPVSVSGYRAIRFTKAAVERHILGSQYALREYDKMPNGGSIDIGSGSVPISSSEVQELRRLTTIDLYLFQEYLRTNTWPTATR